MFVSSGSLLPLKLISFCLSLFTMETIWLPQSFLGERVRLSDTIRIRRKHNQLLDSWRFSRYSAPIHWLDHGHMTSNNETVTNAMSGQHRENYDVKRESVHCTREMLTAVARDRWNLSAVFKFCFCFGLLYNK